MNEAYNIDCLEYMRTLPDNAFDLCIADPPYGDGSGVDMNGLSERERERRSRHGQGRNVRQPDGTWGVAKWRNDTTASDNASTGTNTRPLLLRGGGNNLTAHAEQAGPGLKSTAKKS